MLEVMDLVKTHQGVTALDHVSLAFPDGELVSVIGPNGAGKSTLLSLITQVAPADSGDVLLDGEDIRGYRRQEIAQRISLLRQSSTVNLRLSVRDLVGFGRFPYSRGRLGKEDEAIVDDAIEYLGLGELAGKFIDELSGGERQRAFIAMTLAQSTDYLLLDEPLNNLDMKHSVQIMQTLHGLVDRLGKTVILVIHDINFAAAYSDTILALKRGNLAAFDKTEAIITPESLHAIYDMDIRVESVSGRRVCDYFRPA